MSATWLKKTSCGVSPLSNINNSVPIQEQTEVFVELWDPVPYNKGTVKNLTHLCI